MSYHDDEVLMVKTIKWMIEAAHVVEIVGGFATLLKRFPNDVLTSMIRNGIQLSVVKR